MTFAPSRYRWQLWAWALLCSALLLVPAAVLRFSSLQYSYYHPDEVIAVQVAEGLVKNQSLDTNWERADLPSAFKYPQYNFSGYNLAAAAVLQLRELLPDPGDVSSLEWLRAWSALMGLAVVGLTCLVGRQFFGPVVGLGAAAMAAVNPLLYQDSLYARPETFVTVLTLATVYLVSPRQAPGRVRAFFAAVLMGVLIGTKISTVLLLPVLLLALDPRGEQPAGAAPASHFKADIAAAWRLGQGLPIGVLLGFVLAAPYALANIDDFVDGIVVLDRQYSNGHWPHGFLAGNLFDCLAYGVGYFRATTGWLFLLSFAGAIAAALRREHRQLLVFVVAFATALQFASYPVFFERNLSHVVPLFLVFAACGVTWLAGILVKPAAARYALVAGAVLVAVAPSARTTLKLRLDELPGQQQAKLLALRARFDKQPDTLHVNPGWTLDFRLMRRQFAHWCGPAVIELPSAEDKYSLDLVRRLVQEDGFQEAARVTSLFADVPPSTLHTYFTPTTLFLSRGPDIAPCKAAGGGLVPLSMVGERLPVVRVQADPAWTHAGGYGMPKDPFGSPDYYGSWSGSDRGQGMLRIVVSTRDTEFLVLPYVTGPKVKGQSIVVRDAASGKVLTQARVPQTTHWLYPILHLPTGTAEVEVEAIDAGSAWGQWYALGMLRGLKPR